MNKAISDHMRQLQRRSADARWGGLSVAERKSQMSALAKARWAKRPKTKRVPLRPNSSSTEKIL